MYTAQDEEIARAWDYLLESGINEQTLTFITRINGYSMETLESLLFVATGYHSFDQLDDWDNDDEDSEAVA